MSAVGLRPFIGRPGTLKAFWERHERLLRGQGGVTVLEGETGVGKSTFLESFLSDCRHRGDRVLFARAHPGPTPPPFQLIREALGARVRAPSEPAPDPPPPGSEERLGEVLRRLGDVSETARARNFPPLAELFFALARSAPTILALEDIGNADPASVEFLSYLGPLLGPHRLWVVLTAAPPSEVGEAARRMLEGLPRQAGVDRWVLRALSPGELPEFVRWVDPGRKIHASDLPRWFGQTGGNPLFLEQLVRASHRRTRSLWEEAGSSGVPLTEFVRARVRLLPEEERRVLALGSVIGREIPFSLLQAASGFEEERLAELAEQLVERGLLREVGPETLEFSREDLREMVYADLPEPMKRLLHARIAEALVASRRSDPEVLFSIAHHAYFGKSDVLAESFNRQAAEFAARLYAPEVARTHLERALESLRRAHPQDRAGELEITLELAFALDRIGELDRAETLVREALSRGAPPGAGAGAAVELLPVYLARILTDQGRWDEARKLTDHLLDHLADLGTPTARLALLRLRGEVEYYRGEYGESVRYQDQALEIARGVGDAREMALVTVRRANALAMRPDTREEAIPAYREASAALLREGDRAEAAYALLFLGVTLAQAGRTQEALVELEGAARLAEEAADARELGWALFNISDVKRERGELESASRENQRAREILERIGDRFGLVQVHIIQGKIGLAAGELEEAERELLEAFRRTRELRTEPDELEVLLRLAEVALGRGDARLARERLDELERREIGRLRPDLVGDLGRVAARARAPPGKVGGDAPA